jgi:leucyl aminopeptidase
MDFYVTLAEVRARADCVVLGLHEGEDPSTLRVALDARAARDLAEALATGDFTGRLADTWLVPRAGRPSRLLLVGLGPRKSWSRRQYRRALAAAAQALTKSGVRDALVRLTTLEVPEVDAYYHARFLTEAVGGALYRIPDRKTGRKPRPPRLARVGVVVARRADLPAARRGVLHGTAVNEGTRVTRDLANLPANICTPTYLGRAAQAIGRRHRKIRVRVLGPAQIRRLKMGSFLSVTRGSDEPPRLLVLEYRGARRGQAPIALIGKGVTFDSGGISLKDPPGMDEMKFDMTGAATVIGVISGLAAINAPVNVVGVVPACENMPSGSATKPGDIVTSMSGQTIEVLNTDAEGRLILCDAITYARRLRPEVVIDVATLTGACVIALGQHVSGLMSNDDALAAQLEAAGKRAADPCWRLPIAEEYSDQLKSNFADFANVAGREGGAITAACFLWKFTDGLRWAHLDIAGTAYVSGAAKGSTGRPVPMLVDYCLNRS